MGHSLIMVMRTIPKVIRGMTAGVTVATTAGLVAGLSVVLLAAGCSAASDVAATDAVASGANPAGKVRVVAAEDSWGSVARQVGGELAGVTSIVANPDTDPHDYDATPQDSAAIA